ncbi:MAG: Rid family detoxifying hydrolase [Candidatus Kapabacteria bacterium]|nr:Rid family detoxifying hydrolase [Ignavibacteriota bacterium]MCW5884579.1 Rid family detoxifying hydrolase [Candidatus Kapabacteria bacterium]
MELRSIFTESAPKPAGHYSQAIVHNGLIYIAGILPVHPKDGSIVKKDIKKSVIQVFDNLKAVLGEAGSDFSKMLKITVYISNIDDWGEINKIYAEIMGDSKPARTVIEVARLHHDVILEIDGIAAV